MIIEDKIKFVQSTIEPMAWHTHPYIAGIVAVDETDAGRHVGSALRCMIRGRRAILTAAHVIDEARKTGRIAVTAVREQPPFELDGEPDFQDKHLDVAAYFLGEAYPEQRLEFWPLERVDFTNEQISTDFLFVHGFPGVRARFSSLLGGLVKQSFPYGVMQRDDELPITMKPFEFAMDFDPANMLLVDGKSAEWLDPHGLSGSPVWRIGVSGRDVRDWTPELSVLVGIVTTWCPNDKLIIATNSSYLDQLYRC